MQLSLALDQQQRRTLSSSRFALCLAAGLALSACGGGGGGGGGGMPPSNLSYSKSFALYAKGVPIEVNTPTVTGKVTNWVSEPALPAGLAIDPATGEISGRATAIAAESDYTIKAKNHSGFAATCLHVRRK